MGLTDEQLAEMLTRHSKGRVCNGRCQEHAAAAELIEARKVIAAAKQYALITAAAAPDEACPYCEYYEGIGTKLCWFHEALAHYRSLYPDAPRD